MVLTLVTRANDKFDYKLRTQPRSSKSRYTQFDGATA